MVVRILKVLAKPGDEATCVRLALSLLFLFFFVCFF